MSDKLKKLYQEQLVRVGFSSSRAQQAAHNLSLEQLKIVGQIWSDWFDIMVDFDSDINVCILPSSDNQSQ